MEEKEPKISEFIIQYCSEPRTFMQLIRELKRKYPRECYVEILNLLRRKPILEEYECNKVHYISHRFVSKPKLGINCYPIK